MFRFDDGLRVYVHRDPVDFRMGINGLSIIVEQAMSLNPLDGALYVFSNRRHDRIKIIAWDGNGFWLLLKRLEGHDRFGWPSDAAVVTLSTEQLRWLLQGVDLAAIKKHPKRYYARVS